MCVATVSIICLVGSLLTIMVQIGYINTIHVRAPLVVETGEVPYTFRYNAKCSNISLEEEIQVKMTCPKEPGYTMMKSAVQIRQFANGCVGNAYHSHSPTETIMGGFGAAVLVMGICGLFSAIGSFCLVTNESKKVAFLVYSFAKER